MEEKTEGTGMDPCFLTTLFGVKMLHKTLCVVSYVAPLPTTVNNLKGCFSK